MNRKASDDRESFRQKEFKSASCSRWLIFVLLYGDRIYERDQLEDDCRKGTFFDQHRNWRMMNLFSFGILIKMYNEQNDCKGKI